MPRRGVIVAAAALAFWHAHVERAWRDDNHLGALRTITKRHARRVERAGEAEPGRVIAIRGIPRREGLRSQVPCAIGPGAAVDKLTTRSLSRLRRAGTANRSVSRRPLPDIPRHVEQPEF